jgi:hypothetical protein
MKRHGESEQLNRGWRPRQRRGALSSDKPSCQVFEALKTFEIMANCNVSSGAPALTTR